MRDFVIYTYHRVTVSSLMKSTIHEVNKGGGEYIQMVCVGKPVGKRTFGIRRMNNKIPPNRGNLAVRM